jgi:hypothetical protein
MSQQEVERILNGGGEFDSLRMSAIREIEKIMEETKRRRLNVQNLWWADAANLAEIRYENGGIPFNSLRHQLNGSCTILSWDDDPVMSVLSKMCFDSFPFALLPEIPGHFGSPFPAFPMFVFHPLIEQFSEAVLSDPILRSLFHTTGPNPMSCKGYYYSSLGEGAPVQIQLLPGHLLRAAHAQCCINGAIDLITFQEATKNILDTLRKAISGEPAFVPMVQIMEGVGFPPEFKLKLPQGTLSPITQELFNLLRPEIKPSHDGENNILGCMLVRNVEFKLVTNPENDKPSETGRMPIEMSKELTDTQPNWVSRVTALALEPEIPVAARYLSTYVVNPLGHSKEQWRTNRHNIGRPIIANTEQCKSLSRWATIIDQVDGAPVDLAFRRYISAIIERDNYTDSLIDSVIGLENLFGGRTEISFSIANSVARLLETKEKERSKIFSEIKKIYNLRSSLLHGSSKDPSSKEIREMRNKSIKFLSGSLRALYSARPDLISLNSTERIRKIALQDPHEEDTVERF